MAIFWPWPPSSVDHLVFLVPGGAVVGEVPVVAVRPLAPGDAHAGRVGGAAQHEAHLALVVLEGVGLEGKMIQSMPL